MKKLTAKEQAELFKEWREDEAAGKLPDAHGTREQKDALRKILDEQTNAPDADKTQDRGMEREM